ncbi:hypothetical protein [Nonomuraea sp. B19D2]|uniref:hypothetical protein n=1 Tax=Nonomuraea sp. B19D2 TaxID=3159561 RepID=UPI0032DB5B8C
MSRRARTWRGCVGAGRAFNTEKTYAGRIALYLSYGRGHGVDWSRLILAQLMAMMRWLVDEPMPAAVAQDGVGRNAGRPPSRHY